MLPRPESNTHANELENKLNIVSLARLEKLLGISRVELKFIASRAGSYYRPFYKKVKPRPFQKKSNPTKKAPRKIDNPEGDLKPLQTKIYKALLKPIVFPHYLCGGVPGKTVLNNVYMHLDAPFLVTLDLKKFFRRISSRQVYFVWRQILGCSPRISAILTRLTTFERHLPQGAPTSTLLANLVLFSADRAIREECMRRDVTYSTWVDDLAFSGKNPQTVITAAVDCLHAAQFSISHRKLKRMGPGTRKLLNGVVLDRFPRVMKERLAQLRSAIYKLRMNNVESHEQEQYIRRLQRSIAHVASIDPGKGAKLKMQLLSTLSTQPTLR
jgi:RNA-directed DNA polymerase